MSTKIEEALQSLEGVNNNQVELNHLDDGSILIHIAPKDKTQAALKPGKWAKIAEEMAEENLLKNGLGDQLREHSSQFRQSVSMKPF